MIVPFSARDFLDRAAAVYGERTGIIDEPDQPAKLLDDLTYARVGELARAQAAGLDALGIGPGERIAIVSHNSARLLTSFFGVCGYGRVLVPVNFRLSPAEIDYIVQDSGASALLVDPELEAAVAGISCRRKIVLGAESDLQIYARDVEPDPWGADENATATINTPAVLLHVPKEWRSPTATFG